MKIEITISKLNIQSELNKPFSFQKGKGRRECMIFGRVLTDISRQMSKRVCVQRA